MYTMIIGDMMKPIEDLIGQHFDHLTVVNFIGREGRKTLWECVCSCGSLVEANSDSLKAGRKKSCGCKRIIDITGQRFGKLVVLGLAEHTGNTKITSWRVRCDCGTEKVVLKNGLTAGLVKSCGHCPKPPKPPKERKPKKPQHLEDIKGVKFNHITPVEYVGNRKWRYVCDCGGEGLAERGHIIKGVVKACPACRNQYRGDIHIKDEVGNTYGNFLVLSRGKQVKNGEFYWLVRCACGKEYEVRGSHLRSGSITMCRSCRGKLQRVENPISGYPAEYSLKLRSSIRRRDKHVCQHCNQKFGVGGLDVHHIDHDRTNNDPSNLVSLCNECHYRMHRKDSDAWIPYWQQFMFDHYGTS